MLCTASKTNLTTQKQVAVANKQRNEQLLLDAWNKWSSSTTEIPPGSELEFRLQAAFFMISRNAASHRKERLHFMVQISQLFSTFNVGTLFFFRTLVFSLIMWSWHPPNFSSAFFKKNTLLYMCIPYKISPRLKESNARQLKKLINAVCFRQHVSLTDPIRTTNITGLLIY